MIKVSIKADILFSSIYYTFRFFKFKRINYIFFNLLFKLAFKINIVININYIIIYKIILQIILNRNFQAFICSLLSVAI